MAYRLHVLALCVAVAAATVEVPLIWSSTSGLFNAEISLGTPLQKLKVAVDSGSSTLWVQGFDSAKSSTFKSDNTPVHLPPYADGLQVDGISAHEALQLGTAHLDSVPFLLRSGANATAKVPPHDVGSDGIMGLVCPRNKAQRRKEEVDGLFCEFWRRQSAGTPRTFVLSLGGTSPKLQLGVPLKEGSRKEEGGSVRFAANLFSRHTNLWYTTLRGMSLNTPGGRSFFSPPRSISFDFNSALPTGFVALLDSGAAAIRVDTSLFNMFQALLPGECQRSTERPHASLNCDCKSVEDFPTITFSFEASGNVRLMGLDFGADFLTCMPPTSYVTKKPKVDVCSVAIVDGGKQHTVFGVNSIVLGVPFFRSTTVAYDAERQEVAIGPLAPPTEESSAKGAACACTDPKNWWSTGKRLSGRRIGLCLGLVAGLAVYVFVKHSPSPSAESARTTAGLLFAQARTVRQRGGQRLGDQEGGELTDNNQLGERTRRTTGEVPLQDDDVQSGFVPLNSDAEG